MRMFLLALIAVGLGYGGYRLYTSYETQTAVTETVHERHTSAQSRNEKHRPGSGILGLVKSMASPGGIASKEFGQQGSAPNLVDSTHSSHSSTAIYYSPWQNLEAIDSSVITHSRCDHLDIAMYSFTDRQLALAILSFANSGRQVRIYRDLEQYEQETRRGNRVAQMFQGNPNISIRVKGSRTLMHIKAWSDGCVLREGSANWSPSGEKWQDNTLTLTTDKTSIHNFEADFQSVWNRSENEVIQ